MKSLHISLLIAAAFTLVSCNQLPFLASQTPTSTQTATPTMVPPTPAPPTHTATATMTLTPSLTPTATWIFQTRNITCPILLYHRIDSHENPYSMAARYYMAPEEFRWQMQALKDWGYTSIPISLLVQAVMTGAELPPRPVVITFDDGYDSVIKNAYPIMQELGLSGTLYLVGTYLGADGYMDETQIRELATHGWDVGSHSMTHPHLPEVWDQMPYEAGESKALLKSISGIEVTTFAYPYGEISPLIVEKVASAGYYAAVGLGTFYTHSLNSLYYLSRIEVVSGVDQAGFASLLPWSGTP